MDSIDVGQRPSARGDRHRQWKARMEDLQSDIDKEIARLTDRPPRKRSRRWTLLFVGAQGEVRRIERFAGMALAVALVMAILALTATSLALISRRPMAENRRLGAALKQVEKDNRRLQEEKELLLARLVVMEEQVRSRDEGETAAVGKDESERPAAGGEETTASAAEAPAPVLPEPAAEAEPAPAATPQPVTPPVAVEDLTVTRDAEAGTLAVRFKILNAGPESEPVSGRTFVVMETADADVTHYLTIPRVPLENGRPAKVTNGRYFSIARFNHVTFKAKDKGADRPFHRATVYVFALSGELLLQRPFPIAKKTP